MNCEKILKSAKVKFCFVFGLVVLLGLILRLIAIGIPDPMVDEAIALYFTKFSFWERAGQLYRAEIHPWGFYALLNAWQRVIHFDYGAITGKSLFLLWSQSVVAFFFIAFALQAFASSAGLSRGMQLLLVFGFATNETFVDLGKDLRPYPWLIFFLLLGVTAVIRYLGEGKSRFLALWAIASAAAFAFHLYAVLPIVGQAALLWHRSSSRKKLASCFVMTGVLMLPTVCLMMNGSKLRHLQPLDYSEVFTPAVFLGAVRAAYFPSLPKNNFVSLRLWGEAVGTVLVVWHWLRALRLRLPALEAVLASIGLPLFCLLVTGALGRPIYLVRYYCFVILSFFLVGVLAMEKDLKANTKRKWVSVALLTLVLVNGLWYCRTRVVPLRRLALRRLELNEGLPSPRMAKLGLGVPREEIRKILHEGKAAASDDYAAAELLLHFCPEKFMALQKLNTQIFPPSHEWRDEASAPLMLVYLDDVPSRALYGSRDRFFERSTAPTSQFLRRQVGDYSIWLSRSMFSRRTSRSYVASVPSEITSTP